MVNGMFQADGYTVDATVSRQVVIYNLSPSGDLRNLISYGPGPVPNSGAFVNGLGLYKGALILGGGFWGSDLLIPGLPPLGPPSQEGSFYLLARGGPAITGAFKVRHHWTRKLRGGDPFLVRSDGVLNPPHNANTGQQNHPQGEDTHETPSGGIGHGDEHGKRPPWPPFGRPPSCPQEQDRRADSPRQVTGWRGILIVRCCERPWRFVDKMNPAFDG